MNKKITATVIIPIMAISGILMKGHAQVLSASKISVIIDKAAALYDPAKGLCVDFEGQLNFEKTGNAENFEGSLVMKKDKFVLNTPGMNTWFNGTTQWVYMPQTKEVNVSNPEDNELYFLNPIVILQNYRQNFKVSYVGESTSVNARKSYDIALTPKKENVVKKIEIQIEKNTCFPAKLIVSMHNHLRSIINVKEIREEQRSDDFFVFPEKQYPDVEIIDLR